MDTTGRPNQFASANLVGLAGQAEHGTGPTSADSNASAASAASPSYPNFPDRNTISVENLDDAYIQFILCCNPAVSPSIDTTALRAAFHAPPRSGGKSFSIAVLYDLICRLDERDIKTWGELALKLGVEPPDHNKGQSSQKIQQYAVRLKRWMHSMHVDAFFDYLLERPHVYYTEIPAASIPVDGQLRDGVAAKDDMALRALLPEIKPRRGRRRPDDDSDPEQSGSLLTLQTDNVNSATSDATAAAFSHLFPSSMPQLGQQQQSLQPSAMGNGAQGTGPLLTPPSGITGWPTTYPTEMNLAMPAFPRLPTTPTGSRLSFWPNEPSSHAQPDVTVSPTTSANKRTGRRHGAKAVSSAWRSNGGRSSGKARGRPPINRRGSSQSGGNVPQQTSPTTDNSASAYQPTIQTTTISSHMNRYPSGAPALQIALQGDGTGPTMTAYHNAQPGPLPFHTPERKSADIPILSPHMPNPMGISTISSNAPGAAHSHQPAGLLPYDLSPTTLLPPFAISSLDPMGMATSLHGSGVVLPAVTTTATMTQVPGTAMADAYPRSVSGGMSVRAAVDDIMDAGLRSAGGSRDQSSTHGLATSVMADWRHLAHPSSYDGTNIPEFEAYLFNVMFSGSWLDANNQPDTVCCLQEADALAQALLDDLINSSGSKETFLINLAALAGGSLLMSISDTKFRRTKKTAEHTYYDCSWKLTYGGVVGQFDIQEKIPHSKWRPLPAATRASVARSLGLDLEAESTKEGGMSSDDSLVSDMMANAFRSTKPAATTTTAASTAAPTAASMTNPFSPPGSHGESSGASSDEALGAYWEKKYRDLVHLVHEKDKELSHIRTSVLQSLRATNQGTESGSGTG